MADQQSIPAVKQFQAVMRFLGFVYVAGAIIFILFPNQVMWLVNLLPRIFEPFAALPESTEHFWVPLATSMMVMLVVMTFSAAANPHNKVYPWTHNLAKFCSSFGYLYYFVMYPVDGKFAFPYLLGFLTDFPIFLVGAYLTLRVAWARPPAPVRGEEAK